ncbi:MAG: hypothetical protein ACP5I4_05955 [Oceanipulchritudo sp.]
MNKNRLSFLLLFLLAASVHGQNPVMVAGWDFSQYFSSGITSIDGATYALALPANYSDLDPNGLGAESALYGTLYYDGSNGSTAADPETEILPTDFNLTRNVDPGTSGYPFGAPGSYTVLAGEGQTYVSDLSLLIRQGFESDSLVFAATPGNEFYDWKLAFSAKTTAGGSVSVEVSFSTDGSAYTPVSSSTITGTDSLKEFPVAGTSSSSGFFRVRFSGLTSTINPVIDNVSITATQAPVPAVAIARSGPNLVLSCETLAGFDYLLQGTSDPSGSWSDIETKAGTGSTVVFASQPVPASGNKAFFRVRAVIP